MGYVIGHTSSVPARPLPGRINPWGVLGENVLAVVRFVGLPVVAVVACAVLCSLVVRFRASRDDERQQVK